MSDPVIEYLIKKAMLIDLKRYLREARGIRRKDFAGEELSSSDKKRYYELRDGYYFDKSLYPDDSKWGKRFFRKSSKSKEYLDGGLVGALSRAGW